MRSNPAIPTKFLLAVLVSIIGCVTPSFGQPPRQAPVDRIGEQRSGTATFIADALKGRRTASGEPYNPAALVAAHPSYPMGTVLRVTNQSNGRTVEVTVVDRSAGGPNAPIVDVSRAAAERLDFVRAGRVRVTTEVLSWGPPTTPRR